LMGIQITDAFAVVLFSWGALLASLGLLLNVVRISNITTKRWMWMTAIPLLAWGNSVPFLIQRSLVYEVAIAAAFFCTTTGLYCLSRFFTIRNDARWPLVAGGFFLGLAVGARPNFIFWGATMALISYLLANSEKFGFQRRSLRYQFALWVPYIAVGTLLALYNYLRFDSFTEFGGSYQLAGVNIQEVKKYFFHPSSILPGLYFCLLQPLHVNGLFPFFHAIPGYPGALPPWYLGPEPIAGAFQISPFLCLLLVLPIVNRLSARKTILLSPDHVGLTPTLVIGLLLGQATIQLILVATAWPSATMRYLVDFIPYLLIATVLLWFSAVDKLAIQGAHVRRAAINITAVLLITYGSLTNLGLGMTGYSGWFAHLNPEGYRGIANKFSWIEKREYTYHITAGISQEAEGTDPIMHIGKHGQGDLILLEQLNGELRLGIDHWGSPTVWSDWRYKKLPLHLELKVVVTPEKLEVISDDFRVASPAPYAFDGSPTFGENRIGFSTAPEIAKFPVKSK